MATVLVVCAGCSRHVRATEAACPFCAAALPCVSAQVGRAGVVVAAALAAGLSLAACYGGPPRPQRYSPPTPATTPNGSGAPPAPMESPAPPPATATPMQQAQ